MSEIISKTCERCGYTSTIDSSYQYRLQVKNPKTAMFCNDCRHIENRRGTSGVPREIIEAVVNKLKESHG